MARRLRLTSSDPKCVPAKILNFCSACGQDFGGERAFSMHRVGSHQYDASTDRPDGRRCLTAEEMRGRGMYLNSFGRWSQPQNGRAERLGSHSQTRKGVPATV